MLFVFASVIAVTSCKETEEEILPVAVSSVSVDSDSLSLKVGEEHTLVATILPENADSKAVTWSSDNTEVATVDESTGVVTAVSAGVANITVTTIDGEKTAVCEITVSADERENGEDD